MRWAIVDGKRVPGVKQPDGSVIPAEEPKQSTPVKSKPEKKKE